MVVANAGDTLVEFANGGHDAVVTNADASDATSPISKI